jgi:prepilin-type N-terminal cleavage/methylation domain-containing protein
MCKPNNNQGFTLMEILVVLAIFSTFVVISTDLFLTINRVQRQTQVSERLLSESRYILDTIARELRGGQVNYQAYGDPSDPADAIINPGEELILIGSDASDIRIKKANNANCPSAASSPCVVISRDNGTTWASMTPLGVKVLDFKFIVSPDRDPFYFDGAAWLADKQPMVTAILKIANTDEISTQYVEISNQTSVSQRFYAR